MRLYYEDGSVAAESNWKEGVKDGISRQYATDGSIVMEESYRGGELIYKDSTAYKRQF